METKQPPTHLLVWLVIVAGLLCRLVFVFTTPIFYAPDEQAHFNYINYLSLNHAFPIMPTQPVVVNTWEYCQSPLYYLGMLPLYRLALAMFGSLDATVRLLRLASVLFWLFNMWFGATLLKRLQVKNGFTWVFVMGMASLLPTYTFVSSAINNDNLMVPICGGLLCLLVRRRNTWGEAIGLGLLLGCALLTKQSAAVFIPVTALLTAQDCYGRRIKWSIGALQLGITLAIAGLMYAPWVIRNWQVYGNFTPELSAAIHKVWPSAAYGMASAIHNLVKTFWAVSGVTNDIGYPFPIIGMLLLLLALVSPLLVRKQRPQVATPADGMNQPMMIAFLFAILIYVALVLKFGYVLGMGQGRHVFPALLPIALLLAVGLRRLPLKRGELWAAGFWLIYAASFLIFSLCRFPSHYAI